MKQPYKLLLFSTKTLNPNDIFNSVNMNSYGLITEFSKLSHVTIHYTSDDIFNNLDISDFVLIHTYFDQSVFKQLEKLREFTRYKIMVFMELAHSSKLIDHQFIYRTDYLRDNTTYIKHPIIYDLIKPTINIPKIPGSILLDHVIKNTNVYTNHSPLLYKWLEPLSKKRIICQLNRKDWEDESTIFPEWIQGIQESNYSTYLERTAPYENYIMTHLGSYEHTIIDMISRGSRVIVPIMNGTTLCASCLVKSLNLPTFSTQEELLGILNEPIKETNNEFTDMSTIVNIIDEYCQRSMIS